MGKSYKENRDKYKTNDSYNKKKKPNKHHQKEPFPTSKKKWDIFNDNEIL